MFKEHFLQFFIYALIFLVLSLIVLKFFISYGGGGIGDLTFGEYRYAFGVSFFICCTIYLFQYFICYLYNKRK